ncbi:ATP-grasp fold amidoligase family protein [Clostridium sp. BSD2780061688st1 E8]|uniref:ATP-grasp fold amidoligase family protein n=2 Tax=unclassified Clostridium TaxID=2614128 RepID=UPI001485A5AF|nr:ATP-grasp fold amidoligase family protein [Clostridium sp. BSD2780061688st1 E8]
MLSLRVAMRNVPYAMRIHDALRRKRAQVTDDQLAKVICERYFHSTGMTLDLENPQTYNEKLQWMKVYWRDERVPICVDKYRVREYVKAKGLEHILIDLIGVYERVSQIDFDTLPQKFVLKANHGSGWNILCEDKDKLDRRATRLLLDRWLHDNYYYHGYEWVYKDIRPAIVCEAFLEDTSEGGLKDYKIFCFDGAPRLIQVDIDRAQNHRRNIYDLNWNYVPVSIKYPTDPGFKVEKPSRLEEMLDYARVLSQDFPHVRVDFYQHEERVYFGELTFIHGSGYEKFTPPEYGKQLGDWFTLPKEEK